MTREDEIRQRLDAATPGPWKADVVYFTAEVKGGRPGGEVIGHCMPSVYSLPGLPRSQQKVNCEFVANAWTDLQWALGELARVRRDRQQLGEALGKATVRLEILMGRMEACARDMGGKHGVSLIEVPGWIEEQQATLAKEDSDPVSDAQRNAQR